MIGMPGDVLYQRILFMRHPETVSNVEHFFSGRMDVALSENGERQKERGVRALVAFAPERIYCSPLSRARGMAEEAAAELGVPCTPLDDLIEIDFGPLEGVKTMEARARGFVFPWPVDEKGVSHPIEGGESFEHLRERADRVLDLLRPMDGKTACVTHGGLLRMMLASAYGIGLDRFWDQHIFNVSSLYFTCDHEGFALGGFNMSPEQVIASATQPNEYDTRDVWGTGRKDIA